MAHRSDHVRLPRPRGRVRRWPCGTRAAVTVAILLALSACGQATDDGPSTLRYATASEPDCLDPGVTSDDAMALIGRPIFDSLVALGTDGRFHPWLANRWTISPDGRTYTFFLRGGVTFHDGSPLDAAAVKASLDHVVDPRSKSKWARSLLEGYQGTRAVGPLTVELRMAAPKASLLESLSSAYLGIQSSRALREAPEDRCATPVGSGPFRFVSWQRHDSLVLTRNPAYAWDPGTGAARTPAGPANIDFLFVSEDAVRAGQLTSGQVDVAGPLPPTSAAQLTGDSGYAVQRAPIPGASYGLYLNATHGPLTDQRVRLALRGSLDLDRLVSAVYLRQYARAWSPLSPSTPYYDPSLENSWRPDPAAAGRLLDEAGWTGRDTEGYRTRDGQRLTLHWPERAGSVRDQREIINQGIQAQARKVGIQIDLADEDPGAYARDIISGRLDMFATSYTRADADILRHFWGPRTVAAGGGNVTGLKDPAIITELDRASATADPAVRAAAYRAVQHRLIDAGLVVPVYVPETVLGVSTAVHGLTFDARAQVSFTGLAVQP